MISWTLKLWSFFYCDLRNICKIFILYAHLIVAIRFRLPSRFLLCNSTFQDHSGKILLCTSWRAFTLAWFFLVFFIFLPLEFLLWLFVKDSPFFNFCVLYLLAKFFMLTHQGCLGIRIRDCNRSCMKYLDLELLLCVFRVSVFLRSSVF